MSGRASALEAFRHNPTDGSFALSFYRTGTCTKCPNLRFLSYISWNSLNPRLVQPTAPVLLTKHTYSTSPGSWVRDGGTKPILPHTKRRPNSKVAMSRRASALEAFRHNPTDGSFALSFYRTGTCTKCPNLRFLSYWAGLLSQLQVISRVKLTCLTTV